MNPVLKFELGAYLKKPGIYMVFILLFALGFFIGFKLSFSPGAEIYRNAPYTIASMIGLLSLTCIFFTTILAAQILFKEQDAGFSLILYATPITKTQYLLSRFGALLSLTVSCFILLITGYLFGHMADTDRVAYRQFHLWFYVQPVLIIALPNLLLCSALVSAAAWLGRNKLMVYMTGLFIYIIYLVVLTYSGSPVMAGSLPQSTETMEIAAKIDPFGLSAFYQQTNLWTVVQKNTSLLHFTGNLFINRLGYMVFSMLLLLTVFLKFKLQIDDGRGYKKEVIKHNDQTPALIYRLQPGMASGIGYQFFVFRSLVKLDMKVVIKSIPFVLIALGLVFYLGMEFYGSIDQGVRLPEQYASTALIANRIIYNLPGMLLLVILFYAHELYWRSIGCRFDLIENSTPATKGMCLISKWASLAAVIILLTTLMIVTGILFQIIYRYPEIEWKVYAALYWLIDLPLIICAGLVLILQAVINSKWAGLLVTCVVLFLLTTSLGKSLGITHPLLRFASAYTGRYSEMNGWDDYFRSFSWRMLFGISLIVFLWLAVHFKIRSLFRYRSLVFILPLVSCISTGVYIYRQTPAVNAVQELNGRQAYEQRYRKFNDLIQPVVTAVKTNISLDPERDAYQVKGLYLLKNNGTVPVDKLLVNFDEELLVKSVTYKAGSYKDSFNIKTGFIRLKQPLMPHDSASFNFSFSYHWSGFTGHQSFNAIVHNGSFLRISNYFPRFGYQPDLEITSLAERRKRHLGDPTPLRRLESPRGTNDFINLDMNVSAPEGQTVIGVGNLTRQWQSRGLSYFRYQSGRPIPFRFGISSASYQKRVVNYRGVNVEVYYHSRHFENVQHLIKNACRTMDYCQANFGPYPFKTIRFAEVSSFTDGFAGTAYPATIFMTEHLLFHDNIRGDQGQDVINELAAHELSHQWWGNSQLAPDEREGSKLLTETLAMYTELMMAKRSLGLKAVQEKLAVHQSIYLNERGFAKETPLYKVKPNDTHLYYSKGLLVMFKLSELIGEEKVNEALRSFLQKHTYPYPPPISTDLLTELYNVSPASLHKKIQALFY